MYRLFVFAGAFALSAFAVAQEPPNLGESALGIAPRDDGRYVESFVAPASDATSTTTSVAIDPNNRASVALAYQTIFVPETAVLGGWNGNVAGCIAGTTSQAYLDATIERVNYYRAMAGLPGTVALLGAPLIAGAQDAALMMSANRALNHFPPANWLCYTQAGHDVAGQSNLSLGMGGANAVLLYMDDYGASNYFAGHRRWILYPPQAGMASGSIPFGGASNALRVIGSFGARPPTPNGVAWPPRGYVPWQLLPVTSNRWTFSWPSANFANARVAMTRNGVPLGTPTIEAMQNDVGYADNTIVWRPQGVTYSASSGDVTYHVAISGISGGGAPASVAYDVIAIDPTVVLPDPIFEGAFDG